MAWEPGMVAGQKLSIEMPTKVVFFPILSWYHRTFLSDYAGANGEAISLFF